MEKRKEPCIHLTIISSSSKALVKLTRLVEARIDLECGMAVSTMLYQYLPEAQYQNQVSFRQYFLVFSLAQVQVWLHVLCRAACHLRFLLPSRAQVLVCDQVTVPNQVLSRVANLATASPHLPLLAQFRHFFHHLFPAACRLRCHRRHLAITRRVSHRFYQAADLLASHHKCQAPTHRHSAQVSDHQLSRQPCRRKRLQ